MNWTYILDVEKLDWYVCRYASNTIANSSKLKACVSDVYFLIAIRYAHFNTCGFVSYKHLTRVRQFYYIRNVFPPASYFSEIGTGRRSARFVRTHTYKYMKTGWYTGFRRSSTQHDPWEMSRWSWRPEKYLRLRIVGGPGVEAVATTLY